MIHTVILNPYSNRWQARGQRPAIEAALTAAGLNFKLIETEGPRHATRLAREAVVAGSTSIIAAGGDGLVSEVVNGIMQAGSNGPLGILPIGTGNDFAEMLGIPTELTAAARTIAAGHTRRVDLGVVNDHYFDNNSGIGLEPIVTLLNIRLTWLRGVIRYVVAAVLAILQRPTWHMRLEWANGRYDGLITLVSVGNTRRTGGVFYMTPNAIPDDGLFDFIFGSTMSRRRLLQLLPLAQKGAHIHEPEIHMHRTPFLHVMTRPGTPIQADGEIIATDATTIDYRIVPGALQVLVPVAQSE